MKVLPAIVANIFLVASAFGFGGLLRGLFPQNFTRIDRLAFSLLGGLGILGTILFCVGLAWFSRPAIVLVLLVGVLLGLRSFMGAPRECRTILANLSLPVLPVVIISAVLLVTAIGGLAKPVGDMNNDAIAYHYLGPKVWLRDAVIRPVLDEVQTSFPAAVEAQYAALMSFGGERAPGLFAVTSLISILLISASIAIRSGLDPPGAWWAATLVATMPALYRGAFGGFIDVLFASFVLAAARIAFDAEDRRHYALFGIFCGIAMGTKYMALISWVILIICSFVISVWAHRRPFRIVIEHLGISCIIAIAVASPSYVRNWIFYGCPIYPTPLVLLRFFTLKRGTLASLQEVQRVLLEQGQGMGKGLVNVFLLPFNLTFHTANFRGAGGIGFVPLALGPFGLIARRRDTFSVGLMLFVALQVAAWFLTAQIARYMLQTYVIGAIFGVIGWQYAARVASRYGQALSAAVVAISILYGLAMILPDRVDDMHSVFSSSFEAMRTYNETPRAESFEYINREPSVKKVLILNEGIAAYFIDKPYIKPFGRWGEQTLPGGTDVPHVMSQLPDLHVTHIFDATSQDGSFKLPENPSGLTLVFERPGQRIYRVN